MKPKKKQLKQLEKQSEIERLRSELVHKKQELYDTKLENDIPKKITGPVRTFKGRKKHKQSIRSGRTKHEAGQLVIHFV